jgi:hypothetical protein
MGVVKRPLQGREGEGRERERGVSAGRAVLGRPRGKGKACLTDVREPRGVWEWSSKQQQQQLQLPLPLRLRLRLRLLASLLGASPQAARSDSTRICQSVGLEANLALPWSLLMMGFMNSMSSEYTPAEEKGAGRLRGGCRDDPT